MSNAHFNDSDLENISSPERDNDFEKDTGQQQNKQIELLRELIEKQKRKTGLDLNAQDLLSSLLSQVQQKQKHSRGLDDDPRQSGRREFNCSRSKERHYDTRRVLHQRSKSPISFKGYNRSPPPGHLRNVMPEKNREEPKDEYFYPDEQEPPTTSGLISSLSSRNKDSDAGRIVSSVSKFGNIENIRVVSRVEDEDDFSESRRVILPSRTIIRDVSSSPVSDRSLSPIQRQSKQSLSH